VRIDFSVGVLRRERRQREVVAGRDLGVGRLWKAIRHDRAEQAQRVVAGPRVEGARLEGRHAVRWSQVFGQQRGHPRFLDAENLVEYGRCVLRATGERLVVSGSAARAAAL